MKEWLIKKLGGFSTTDEFIAKIRKLPLEEKNQILTMAVKRLFNTIGAEDILRNDTFEGRPMNKNEMDALRQSAKLFSESQLWKVLRKEISYQANKGMYIKAEKIEDIIAGKILLYFLDIIKTRLKEI